MDFVLEHATGPTGGLVLLAVIVGAGSGWLSSRRETVSRERLDELERLHARIVELQAENAALYDRLADAASDPRAATVRQLEHVAAMARTA